MHVWLVSVCLAVCLISAQSTLTPRALRFSDVGGAAGTDCRACDTTVCAQHQKHQTLGQEIGPLT